MAAKRGRQVATIAVARRLIVLAWNLLSRQEDYAFARPSLVRRKLRAMELTAGAPRAKPGPTAIRSGAVAPRAWLDLRPRSEASSAGDM